MKRIAWIAGLSLVAASTAWALSCDVDNPEVVSLKVISLEIDDQVVSLDGGGYRATVTEDGGTTTFAAPGSGYFLGMDRSDYSAFGTLYQPETGNQETMNVGKFP